MRFTAHTMARLTRIADALLSTNWSEGLLGQMAYSQQMPDEQAYISGLCAATLASIEVERVHAFGRVGERSPVLYAGQGAGTQEQPYKAWQGSQVRGHDAALRSVTGSPTAIHPYNWPVTTSRVSHPCWGCCRH
jgi:hypothetical protein